MPECQLVGSWRIFLAKFPLQSAIFVVWPMGMIIWQAGSAIDSCQSARAQRQAHFDPDKLIQQPWALAVQAAHSSP
jgi:hypothetical protein